MSVKKKHKRKRSLSEEEKKRKTELYNERVKRKKREKRVFYLEILLVIVLVLSLILVAFILGFQVGSYAVKIYIAIILIIFALLSDRSGIRSILFSKCPDRFPFSGFLKSDTQNRSFLMELARTCFYISTALFLAQMLFCKIWSVIMIISIAIGFFYVVTDTDNRYTFDKFSKCSDTTMFLIIGPLFQIEIMSEYSFYAPIMPTLIGTAVLLVLYMLFARNPHKKDLTFEIVIFAPLNIILICFLFSFL